MSGARVGFQSGESDPADVIPAEVGYIWHKSSHSASGAGQCVEVAALPRAVHVRDSKSSAGPELGVTPDAWARFVVYAARQAD
ncbi:DUF397 domain-containing protein [Streptomyces clavuligerus]|uniref:DUF397 domain-containing protein n=1 Tax=Streptomyces clavuligerus TaxID=1901 RepID=B5GYX1_STRCL|nr:DUF397 domain-containing protein [Streptomyces clavuligerus]ANW18555.1 DUF397 domain-containing protein [Streptomyces clavuligerus]AXU13116.1 DUF397 domain-containing protein [Streptomyces clavuligerus]EDY51517.1 hypothetical protein SSCG_04484 [Streptomyces clavuligerus]EFG08791.1 DUF397 domain-containing protein [Streptomyces clavuligerus]MBY6303057.1 DUF397 domain-containing protein [Streptomyces clavuligerus]